MPDGQKTTGTQQLLTLLASQWTIPVIYALRHDTLRYSAAEPTHRLDPLLNGAGSGSLALAHSALQDSEERCSRYHRGQDLTRIHRFCTTGLD